MGLTSRNLSIASLKTILLVQIVPWFVIAIGVNVLGFGILFSGAATAMGTGSMFWYIVATGCSSGLLAMVKNCLFWRWAQRRLLENLRQQATLKLAPVIPSPASLVPPPPLIKSQP